MILNGATVEDLRIGEERWMLDTTDRTLWEYIEACPHWDAVFVIEDTSHGKFVSTVDPCPGCGQRLTRVRFGEFVEMRTKQCRIEKWKHCVLSGLPDSLRRYCDCKFHPRSSGY